MFVFSIFIVFMVQSVIGNNHGVEQCKPEGSQWSFENTVYHALEYRNELYAYPLCSKGFTTSSIVKVRCVNGWWESPLPRCAKITSQECEVSSLTNHLIRNCEEGAPAVGKRCNYRCQEPYYLIGSSIRQCMQNLQWSGKAPQCISLRTRTHSVSSFNYSSYATAAPRNTHPTGNSSNRNKPTTNPCSINRGGCDHYCSFQEGSKQCTCGDGYRLENGTKCKGIFSFPVIPRRTVITGDNSHRITTTDSTNHHRKVPVDPCKTNNGGCHQVCSSSSGIANCSCQDGYRMLSNGFCTVIPRRTPVITSDNSHRITTTDSTNHHRKVPVDPCKTNNGGCHQVCSSSSGFANCSCQDGYRMLSNGICTDIDECRDTRRNPCSHKCKNNLGSFSCSCEPGYYLKDKYNCEDMDECRDMRQNLCNHKCVNFPGSFRCSCESGYYLKDKYNCEDVDECQRKDTNLCNQHCHNVKGSYNCSCEPGYVLKNRHECEGCRKGSYRPDGDIYCRECPPNSFTDSEAKSSLSDCICVPGFIGDPSLNKPCEDIDECAVSNFGCSDICVNTPGSAHCSCSIGFELQEDNKTCVDIDECKIKNGGCQMICLNRIGNFSCYCTNGYFLSRDGYSCDDVDECAENNGGCSDMCINFPGGFYCSCPKGYRLDVEGKTCIAVRCPALAVPHHSTIQCLPKTVYNVLKPNDDSSSAPDDYPVNTECRIKCKKGYSTSSTYGAIKCLDNGIWNSSTPECIVSHCPPLVAPENGDVYPPTCTEGPISVKQQCYFTCRTGYHLTQKRQNIQCKNNLQWSADIQPSCEADTIIPVINCPDDITIELKTNESWANVTIPKPVTNMEDIEIFPVWISITEPVVFPSGITDILFKASDVKSNATAVCILTVSVIDKEPPSFVLCPDSIKVDSVGSLGTIVEWEEPYAVDNVGVKYISRNLEPNSRLPAGVHHVEYMAIDEAGNIARCSFEIEVSRGDCGNLKDPANGKANCMDWLLGKLCRPSCEPGYSRYPDETKFYACGDTGIWTPSDVISPCLPECVNGTIWSPITEICEEFDKTWNFTTTTEQQ